MESQISGPGNSSSELFVNYYVAMSSFDESEMIMIDDQALGFLANFLGIFVFALVIAYHYVAADPKYEGN
ncbi:Dolichyl-diphosphooligosaccharide--protein glycosyltransferase subunit 4A, partial [Cucurbita argyrosperma subsp. argyrosperma]